MTACSLDAPCAVILGGFLLFGAVSVRVSADEPGAGAAGKPVRYSDFGAIGDGKADDLEAIAKAHAFANEHGRPVRADDEATYYMGGAATTVVIQTPTDFGKARFVIDDRKVADRGKNVFVVSSTLEAIRPVGVSSLGRGQDRIDVELPRPCVVVVSDRNVRRFVRRGSNPTSGSPQTDVFICDQSGRIDSATPIIWNFEKVTGIVARPIDDEQLTITGGHFTTIANQSPSEYKYHARGMAIRRSNVLIGGLEHHVTGEGNTGAPYWGFLTIEECANVILRDSKLAGHKTYRTVGRAGRPVAMGSYDISVRSAVNVSFINCRQTNDINDQRYWGVMTSNYCKNLVLDGCVFNRFDAHEGVADATIRNCTIGHVGINAIGTGTLLVENTTVLGRRFINLRPDYGSTWKGRFVIRNCTFRPNNGTEAEHVAVIHGSNDGKHDFGYPCHMPETIEIDGLRIDDRKVAKGYKGPALLDNFNRSYTSEHYREKYPYIKTKKVVMKGVTSASGKSLRVSENPVMFRGIRIDVSAEH